ncbi:MAG: PLDc_N domain-containing protein [Chloroflexia bacterium]|nr:PLDc_N domain-containing protein [Chloroflexia bacterium]
MTIQTAIAITVVVLFGTAQYTLMYGALRDLLRRSRVRGGNKAAWALVIMCLPLVGPLLYSWMGPTSLNRRPATSDRPVARRSMHYAGRTSSRRNVTPIGDARSRRTADSPAPTAKPRDTERRFPRTGS